MSPGTQHTLFAGMAAAHCAAVTDPPDRPPDAAARPVPRHKRKPRAKRKAKAPKETPETYRDTWTGPTPGGFKLKTEGEP